MAILGIDEVGRGPLAGPLVVGAVILADATEDWCVELTDSKQLSPTMRERLNEVILKRAAATATGWVSCEELNELGNIIDGLRLATRRAVEEIQRQKVPFNEIMIDGDINFLSGTKLEPYTGTLVKGDLLMKEISAASIIAKVARDNYMKELGAIYPGYGFEKHMGYGTPQHRMALAEYGPCPEHRQFVKPVAEITAKTTREIGNRAENVAAKWLVSQGHKIVGRNVRTKFYEIDIVSVCDRRIYFTEVKYRRDAGRGSALEMIGAHKMRQMRFAAEAFLRYKKQYGNLEPVLAAAALSGADFHLDEWFPIGVSEGSF